MCASIVFATWFEHLQSTAWQSLGKIHCIFFNAVSQEHGRHIEERDTPPSLLNIYHLNSEHLQLAKNGDVSGHFPRLAASIFVQI